MAAFAVGATAVVVEATAVVVEAMAAVVEATAVDEDTVTPGGSVVGKAVVFVVGLLDAVGVAIVAMEAVVEVALIAAAIGLVAATVFVVVVVVTASWTPKLGKAADRIYFEIARGCPE